MNPADPTIYVAPPSVDVVPFFTTLMHKITVLWPSIVMWLKGSFGLLVGLSFPISVFFAIVIIYCVEQLKVIRKREEAIYDAKVVPAYEDVPGGADDTVLASRWEIVVKLMSSNVESDWKQAILQADIILDELLTKMGYRGLGAGEKLKRVEQGDFKTLREAWDAHMVRNQIAHGAGFTLNQIEAQRTFNLYKKVFEEFYYI